jgi:outer membrane protein assembly factor BamB
MVARKSPKRTSRERRPRFVERTLRIDGERARAVKACLDSTRRRGPGLRSRLIEALGEDLDSSVLPTWVMVGADDLGDIIHLAPPLFHARIQDEDEFWHEVTEEQLVYQGKGRAVLLRPDEDEPRPVKLKGSDLPRITCSSPGGVVLTGITWHEPVPRRLAEFERILRQAEAALADNLEAYDAGDFRPPPASEQASPAAVPAVVPPGGVFLGGPGRQGAFSGKGPRRKPRVAWRLGTSHASGGEWGGNVVVADGVAVAASSSFNAFFVGANARTGKLLWAQPMSTSHSWPTSEPCVAHGVLYMGTNLGLHAVDARRGTERWRAMLSGVTGAPLIVGDRCYIGAGKALYALSTETGRKQWTFPLRGAARGAPAWDDGVLFFFGDDTLFAVEEASKKVRWKVRARGHGRHGPVVLDELVIFAKSEDTLAAVDKQTGQERWAVQLRGQAAGSISDHTLAAAEGMVVFRTGEGRIVALAAKTGRRRWVYDVGGKPYGIGKASPIIGDGTVYTGVVERLKDGEYRTLLVALDLQKGSLLWKLGALDKDRGYPAEFRWHATPFLHEGLLYAQTQKGLVALR